MGTFTMRPGKDVFEGDRDADQAPDYGPPLRDIFLQSHADTSGTARSASINPFPYPSVGEEEDES